MFTCALIRNVEGRGVVFGLSKWLVLDNAVSNYKSVSNHKSLQSPPGLPVRYLSLLAKASPLTIITDTASTNTTIYTHSYIHI